MILSLRIFAYADTILLGSHGTGAADPGVINTAVLYSSTTSTVNANSTITYDISPDAIWYPALPNSIDISAPIPVQAQPTFDVKEVNLAQEGLDFTGFISRVPEPVSLALFATGLFGAVSLMRRRFQV